ncbi:MAG TPA: glycosyl transferase, partial [Verrucomicrobiota bacterium]|nr:glycosyl transferase [Verrucomicrobiota bacterium]
MSDFFQTGAVATLHRLGRPNVERLEQELERFSEENPIALVLPCHVRELGTPALRLILSELKSVTYIQQIIVGIDGSQTALRAAQFA